MHNRPLGLANICRLGTMLRVADLETRFMDWEKVSRRSMNDAEFDLSMQPFLKNLHRALQTCIVSIT
jgi:hypothetical protein